MTTSVLDGATPEHWRMVEENTGLVWFFIHRMNLPAGRHEDAFQDGCIGLLRAAMKFDPERGLQFSTYAGAWIRQAIHVGNARLEGGNYRRARDSGEEYVRPDSLDATIWGESKPLIALLVDEDDPAESATFRVTIDDLSEACVDQLDRDLLAMMRAGTLDKGGGHRRGSVKLLAAKHGKSTTAVSKRLGRLRHLSMRALEDAA